MYMPYLMYGYAASLVLMVLGCWVSVRTVPGLRGARLLGWSLSCGMVSVLLFATRPFAPALVSIVAANGLLFATFLLIYCAVADTLDVPRPFVRRGVVLGAAGLAGICCFTYGEWSLVARILFSSGACAVYAIATAVLLFQHADPEGEAFEGAAAVRVLTLSLAWLETAVATVQTARCGLSVVFPPVSFVHLDPIQAGFTYLDLILELGIGCGLLWFAHGWHRRELQAIARSDSLTGMLNRRAFEEILCREVQRAALGGTSFAVLLLDIDRFKEVNDSQGHQAGDEVIRRVSAVLREGIRPADAVARYGGEEFVILMREASAAGAEEAAERLRSAIAGLTSLPGGIVTSVSIGVDVCRRDDSPEELLRRCDEAMYRSKHEGRNRVTRAAAAVPVATSRQA